MSPESNQVAYLWSDYNHRAIPCMEKKKNPCQKNLHLWPSLERGSCGACCSSVWLMIGPCSLWSMTGPQWTSPIATTQMWQADQAGRHWQGESRTDGKALSRVFATQQNQTNCLRIHFRFPSLTVLQARPLFWLLNRSFSFTFWHWCSSRSPCCTEPRVFKVNQSGCLYMPGCICNLVELSVYHAEIVRESRSAASLNNPDSGLIMRLDRQQSPAICCQILQQWREVRVGLMWVTWGGTASAHTTSQPGPGSSSSRLNGILNMAVLTLRAAIKHLEEFSPSNYICHCQPFSENRARSP